MALKDYRAMMERCSNCLGCKWSPFDKLQSQRFGENCPENLYYRFHLYSARGKFQAAQGLLDGDYGYTGALLEATTACTACGACDVACKICRYNLEPLEFNLALKHDAVESGNALPVQREIIAALESEQTMLRGVKRADRANWAKGIPFADPFREEVEAIYFPGCRYSYDESLLESVRAGALLLLRAGVKLGFLGAADTCCAGRAHQQGFFTAFEARAAANKRAFEKAGAPTIITPCADCYHALKRQYARLGLSARVLHITEALAGQIKAGKLRFDAPYPLRVTYHDPCHLGRLGEPYVPWEGTEEKILNQVHTWSPRRPRYNGAYGVYDAPRDILAAIPGVELVEMERIREYALCCGAGACSNEVKPELSAFTAAERVTEARASGADAIVTACPWCVKNLSSALDETGRRMPVMDIVTLVLRALAAEGGMQYGFDQ